MQRQRTSPSVKKKPEASPTPRTNRDGQIAIYKGALTSLLLALLYRLLAYHACNYLRDQKPELAHRIFPLVSKPLAYAQFALSFSALVSDRVRRFNPTLLLAVLALMYGISGALPQPNSASSTTTLSEQPLSFSQDPDSPLNLSFTFEGLSPEEFIQVSLDTQPTMYLSVPIATAMALVLPIPGSHIIVTGIAGVLPYVTTKVHTLAAGWDQVSWAATIGSTLSGIFSFLGCWWLLSTTWKLAGGRSMTGVPIQLNDPVGGRNPQDHAYVAAWTILHFFLAPLWLLIFAVRTWLWVLSCGFAFNGRAVAQRT